MKLSKDEAAIVAAVIEKGMYEFSHSLEWHTKEELVNTIGAIEKLKNKIKSAGVDERRKGRTSSNSPHDLVRRIIKKYQ